MPKIEFHEEIPTFSSVEIDRQSFLTSLVIKSGLAKNKDGVKYTFFGIVLFCILLSIFFLGKRTDSESVSVPPPGYIPPSELPK